MPETAFFPFYKSAFVSSVILGGIRSACGACYGVHPRYEFVRDVADSSRAQSAVYLLALGGMTAEEEEVLRADEPWARDRLLVHVLSDAESGDPSVSSSPSFTLPRIVLRTCSLSEERPCDMSYLIDDAADSGKKPAADFDLWVPLGTSDAFLPHVAPEGLLSVRDRPLLWSWSGNRSTVELTAFLASLAARPARAVLARGILETTFQIPTVLKASKSKSPIHAVFRPDPWKYSRQLHDSQIAPCPDGGSIDQVRVFDALQAGAIP